MLFKLKFSLGMKVMASKTPDNKISAFRNKVRLDPFHRYEISDHKEVNAIDFTQRIKELLVFGNFLWGQAIDL